MGRIIFGQYNRIGARIDIRQTIAGAADVETRHRDQADVVFNRFLPFAQILGWSAAGKARGHDAGMRHHRTLGPPGCARGVKLKKRGVTRNGDAGCIAALGIAPSAIICKITACGVDPDHLLDARTVASHLVQHGFKAFADKHQFRLAIVENISDLGRG